MSNTILVTGATGFVARHLIPVLIKQNWQIKAATRQTMYRFPAGVTTIPITDIDATTNWAAALDNVFAVVHLAARAHILYEDLPAEHFKVNTEGTANLIGQAIQAGVQQFIFVSSVGAMTSYSSIPLTESCSCQPDTPYGKSKLRAEQVLIELASPSGMGWTIFRPPLIYGRGNPGNMARLIHLVQRRLPLPLGLVKNQRSFLYIKNLTDAIALCLRHPQARNQTFLIADRQPISTPELIRKIADYLGVPCHLLPVPPSLLKLVGRMADTLALPFNSETVDRLLGSLIIDSSHIQITLDWQPPYATEDGLSDMLQGL